MAQSERRESVIAGIVSALTLPIVMIVARARPLRAEVRLIQRFDDSFTALWETLAPKFDLGVRRDAAYLNWKYVSAPHVRYSIAVLRRDDQNVGYVVYRHLYEPPSWCKAQEGGVTTGRGV